MAGRRWTKEEESYLKMMYYETDWNTLTNVLERTQPAVLLKALSLGLSKKMPTKSNLRPLLKDTNKAFYWIGFLLADGSFNGDRLSFYIKDQEQLQKFADFIGYDGEDRKTITCQDTKYVPALMSKFGIKHNKTYNPPEIDISQFEDNLIWSLICGFVDGDGCIDYQTGRKSPKLRIKLHSSWIDFLEQIGSFIVERIESNVSVGINNQGYAGLVITDTRGLKEIKLKVLELDIPFLDRKWSRIDHESETQQEVIKKRLDGLREYRVQGNSMYEFAKDTGVPYTTIKQFCYRRKIAWKTK